MKHIKKIIYIYSLLVLLNSAEKKRLPNQTCALEQQTKLVKLECVKSLICKEQTLLISPEINQAL